MPKTAYHHGNLRAALISTAVRRVRDQQPDALVARALARDLGVSSAAVYRHVPDVEHLRAEVAREARQELARTMLQRRAEVSAQNSAQNPGQNPAQSPGQTTPRSRSAGEPALARFRATGAGYVEFALAEPGLFAVAFMPCHAAPDGPDDPSAWEVLTSTLDEVVAAGLMPAARAEDAAVIAWTAVHGLASILSLSAVPEGTPTGSMTRIVLDGIERSLGLGG